MSTPNDGQAAAVRPFTEVLSELNHGIVADQAATQLAELVAAVKDTGRKGTLKLTIEIAPFKGNDDVLKVTGSVDLRAPKGESPAGVFYTDATGNLSRNDPRQLELPNLRDLDAERNHG